MSRLDSLISGTVAISLLLFSLSTQARILLRRRFKPRYKKLTVVQNPAYEGPARREDRLAKAEEVVLSYFDTREFARRAFGRYWSQRTPAEQQEFVRLFTASLACRSISSI
jgi:ABC-type transporter MlaC component